LAFSHKVADAETDSNWYTIIDIFKYKYKSP
jgi:hypothetical protein